MRTIVWACALAAVGGLLLSGCSTAPKSEAKRENLETEAQAAIQTAKNTDPGLQKFFDTAAGYAVFPNVGKAAWVVGGAYGKGILYEHGQPVGYCDMTQATSAWPAGGQAYTEIIFFETPEAVNKFKAGQLALAAQASRRRGDGRRLRQRQVLQRRPHLYAGRGGPDGRGLGRRAEVQLPAAGHGAADRSVAGDRQHAPKPATTTPSLGDHQNAAIASRAGSEGEKGRRAHRLPPFSPFRPFSRSATSTSGGHRRGRAGRVRLACRRRFAEARPGGPGSCRSPRRRSAASCRRSRARAGGSCLQADRPCTC